MTEMDNETWLLETGHEVIVRKTEHGESALTPLERLIYCLWAADYGIRNAGDLQAAADVHPQFHEDGRNAARDLDLPAALALFSLDPAGMEQAYLERFDSVVDELRTA
jgi:hypothetical protein